MVGIRSICEFPNVDIFDGASIDDDINYSIVFKEDFRWEHLFVCT
jgi:hypothetical protein